MKYKKIIIAVVVVIIATLIGLAAYNNTYNKPMPVAPQSATTTAAVEQTTYIPLTDESHFQQQIQSIIATGKDSDCDTIADPRYQMACHTAFKSKATQ